jgi:hypothetical protein
MGGRRGRRLTFWRTPPRSDTPGRGRGHDVRWRHPHRRLSEDDQHEHGQTRRGPRTLLSPGGPFRPSRALAVCPGPRQRRGGRGTLTTALQSGTAI